ncbi:glycosyltransferase [Streptomyces sp. NBC_01455]|uniref:glycosyltransferase n=1 Tax=Streptomyces sp. NBC_01455 TaxID=2903874 RepID=UPI002E377147|nr:glycosyltransferase [Streptomyces sp. NBC_01455]
MTLSANAVTVVVPVRDRPDLLAKLARSLVSARKDARTEVQGQVVCIVVDDRSKVAPSLPGDLPGRVIASAGPGPGTARNTGARAASSPWLLFTDSDCTVEPDWLLAAARHLRDPAKRVVQGDPTRYSRSTVYGAREEALYHHMFATYITVDRLHTEMLDSRNLLVRRDALLEVGGFDTLGLDAMAESRTLAARFRAAGTPLHYAEDMVVRHAAPASLDYEMAAKFRHGRGRVGVWGRRPPEEATMAWRYFVEPLGKGMEPGYVFPVHIAFLAGYSHETCSGPTDLPTRVLRLVPEAARHSAAIDSGFRWLRRTVR